MRKNALLPGLAAAFAAIAPSLVAPSPGFAMPLTPASVAQAAAALSAPEKVGYWIGYSAPYAYYQPYAYYGTNGYYQPYAYYSGVPAYSYYDYYQTYGCSFPAQYCIYYAW